ncbi:hypothetical protein C8Q75DRAFT_733924 [Abortiporus biennis]|nr:hypothetical protein C8Q75DRAFT_733924 [Abortiporus biennis]
MVSTSGVPASHTSMKVLFLLGPGFWTNGERLGTELYGSLRRCETSVFVLSEHLTYSCQKLRFIYIAIRGTELYGSLRRNETTLMSKCTHTDQSLETYLLETQTSKIIYLGKPLSVNLLFPHDRKCLSNDDNTQSHPAESDDTLSSNSNQSSHLEKLTKILMKRRKWVKMQKSRIQGQRERLLAIYLMSHMGKSSGYKGLQLYQFPADRGETWDGSDT